MVRQREPDELEPGQGVKAISNRKVNESVISVGEQGTRSLRAPGRNSDPSLE